MGEDLASEDGPARRRPSWSLKTIVEDTTGKPIGAFQDPNRPMHPYLQAKGGGNGGSAPPRRPSMTIHQAAIEYGELPPGAPPEPGPLDPVDRVYPPLSRSTGRELHGPGHEHHAATLASVARSPADTPPEHRARGPGPSARPERIYLHYLLLHLDRLNDSGLRYLKRAVEEELEHRAGASNPAPVAEPPTTEPPPLPAP